jgi:gamma-glutamyl:cysteine ligase YbdK (ATP-grasp superfamily)
MNRFRAGRYGFEAQLINAKDGCVVDIQTDILNTLNFIRPYVGNLACKDAFDALLQRTKLMHNDASISRQIFKSTNRLEEVVAANSELWRENSAFMPN